jgi:hypothetical protein
MDPVNPIQLPIDSFQHEKWKPSLEEYKLEILKEGKVVNLSYFLSYVSLPFLTSYVSSFLVEEFILLNEPPKLSIETDESELKLSLSQDTMVEDEDGFQNEDIDVSPRAVEDDSCLATDCYSRSRTKSSTSTRCDSLESNVAARRRRRNLSTETIVEDYMVANYLNNESSKTMKFVTATEETSIFKPVTGKEDGVENVEKRSVPSIPSQEEIIAQINVSCQVSESDFLVNAEDTVVKKEEQRDEVYSSPFPYEEIQETPRANNPKNRNNQSQSSQFSFSICGCEESNSTSSSKKTAFTNPRRHYRTQSHKSSSSFGCVVC